LVTTTLIVDGRNVQRSLWPNIPSKRLVELVRDWAEQNDVRPLIVFDGPAPVEADDVVGTGREIADDWIAREAPSYAPYWLVTSDRGLRERVGRSAERVLGGGGFARELTR
jgi:hypothetical protein